jgi:hypothetical protein
VDTITIESHNCAARHGYLVTFEGDNLEARVLAFMDGRSSTHAFCEVEESPFDGKLYPLLAERLYPTCPHGLSASLCEGPNHYPRDDM